MNAHVLCRTPWLILILILSCVDRHFYIQIIGADVVADPKFSAPISNVTVPVGREAMLTCVVQDLGSYKVAWLRVDTQTILTIQNHVITKNQRIGITYSEHKTWQLKIKDIKESDRGWYMCQINTDPMKSQMGYLDVVVPPDILDSPASSDRMEKEGTNVTLKCAATGSPEPTITWRREKGELIELPNGSHEASVTGSALVFPRVKRQHMGAYLCIASNGIPPSVSKRIKLTVHFPPMITVQNQLIGAVEGKGVTLECQSEAYPRAINYWTRERGGIVPPGGHYTSNVTIDSEYRSTMKLHIYPLTDEEFGTYRCVAKNSLGDTDGTIKLYRIPPSAVNYLENYEGRSKGKKRLKTSELYHPSKSIDVVGDNESSGKWKDIIPRKSDENVYESSSANSRWLRIAVISSIVKTMALTLMSIATYLIVL